MRIVYVSDRDLAGGRFNGYDSFPALRAAGHDPHMLVWMKDSLDPAVHLLRQGGMCKFSNALGNRLDDLLSFRALAATGSHFIAKTPVFQSADLVHLQLVHATPFFSLLSLPRITRLKPTVWTLHDPWVFTGHCVHPMDCTRWESGCGQCPDLERNFSVRRDTTAAMFRYKRAMFKRSALDIIVASQWMRRLCERSPMFAEHRVHVVPFGLDLRAFKPAEGGALRQTLGIAQDAFVVCFRNSDWSVKGGHVVEQALQRLPASRSLHIVTLGGRSGLPELASRFPVTELGWVDNSALLAAVYTASDVFVMPSYESFGMMALESLACGTPVVCMEGGAVEELCRPPQAGLATPAGDVPALEAALLSLMDDPHMRQSMSEQAVRIAAEYTADNHLQALTRVYTAVMERHTAESAGR